jgi:hypothetical protein
LLSGGQKGLTPEGAMSEHQSLEECRKQIAELEAENDALRKSAETFAALAERLNRAARGERRVGTERQQLPNPPPNPDAGLKR